MWSLLDTPRRDRGCRWDLHRNRASLHSGGLRRGGSLRKRGSRRHGRRPRHVAAHLEEHRGVAGAMVAGGFLADEAVCAEVVGAADLAVDARLLGEDLFVAGVAGEDAGHDEDERDEGESLMCARKQQ